MKTKLKNENKHTFIKIGPSKFECVCCGVIKIKYPPPATFYKNGLKLESNPLCNNISYQKIRKHETQNYSNR